MTIRRRSLLTVTAALLALTMACSEQDDRGVGDCPDEHLSVRTLPADSLTSRDVCAIIRQAREAAEEAVRLGNIPDTALSAWESALIVSLTEVTSGGVPLDPTWVVQISLGGSPFDLQAVVNRRTGQVEVELVHKPL